MKGLPWKGFFAISRVEAKTAYVTINVPLDMAAYIHGDTDTVSNEIDLARFQMIKEGGAYRSKRYKIASKRVDIRIDHTMSSIKIVEDAIAEAMSQTGGILFKEARSNPAN